MIAKEEVLRIAGQLGLGPQVVEKDYALGWLLAGIFANDRIGDSWVFKGGTCLKKCFFETYRFSEDLDFTLQDRSHLDDAFLKEVFAEIGEWVYEQCGLEMPADRQDFDIYDNPRGNKNCQGKITFRGPVTPTAAASWPRIKLDLTADERIVLAPVRQPIFHPYSDAPDADIVVLSYAYEEAFGEKIRALAERTRPRDLYDVINLYRNTEARPSPVVLLDVLRQKCEYRSVNTKALTFPKPPTSIHIEMILRPAGSTCCATSSRRFRPLNLSGRSCRNFSLGWRAGSLRRFRHPTQPRPVRRFCASGRSAYRWRLFCSPISKSSASPPQAGFASISIIRAARDESSRTRSVARRKSTLFFMPGIPTRTSTAATASIASRVRTRPVRCSARAMLSSSRPPDPSRLRLPNAGPLRRAAAVMAPSGV
jgi:predicted nucleotidyltransferase component of viral defense system